MINYLRYVIAYFLVLHWYGYHWILRASFNIIDKWSFKLCKMCGISQLYTRTFLSMKKLSFFSCATFKSKNFSYSLVCFKFICNNSRVEFFFYWYLSVCFELFVCFGVILAELGIWYLDWTVDFYWSIDRFGWCSF